jgi:hypothetical protein
MTDNEQTVQVACTLSQQDLRQRAQRWQALTQRAGQQVSRTDSGLRLTFRRESGVAAELDELVAAERDCCAFARWSVTPVGDCLVLDISAEDQVAVEAVQAMFDGPPGATQAQSLIAG